MITRTTCRVSGGPLHPILSLGEQYVSNYLDPGEPDGTAAPLELVLCPESHMLQLKHTVEPEFMYEQYWYRSGTNQTMRDALAEIAQKAQVLMHLKEGDTVLDIGCNDGTLLSAYTAPGLFKVGIDPAKNLAEHSSKFADRVIVNFFSEESFRLDPEVAERKPKVVTSIAMFYDLEDPNKFVADIKAVMHPDGVWVVQQSYLPLMLKTNELGNICHEHLEYHSMKSMDYLLARHGMEIVDVELNDVNGGSFRTLIRNKDANQSVFGNEDYRNEAAQRVAKLRKEEDEMKLDTPQPYEDFAYRINRIKNDVVSFIEREVEAGKKVYVYGASTKGNVVLQYYGLDTRLITAAAERNPQKWGKETVGTRIPIVSEEEARKANPDYFLVLPWHFLDEFIRRERDYLHNGGRFILPAPYFTIV
ncbi:MAG: class I SAM-dependent methyltransferase [Fimbriimonadaceae bacterium]